MSKFLSQAQLLYMKQDEAARQIRVCSNSKFRPNTEYIRYLKKHWIEQVYKTRQHFVCSAKSNTAV